MIYEFRIQRNQNSCKTLITFLPNEMRIAKRGEGFPNPLSLDGPFDPYNPKSQKVQALEISDPRKEYVDIFTLQNMGLDYLFIQCFGFHGGMDLKLYIFFVLIQDCNVLRQFSLAVVGSGSAEKIARSGSVES